MRESERESRGMDSAHSLSRTSVGDRGVRKECGTVDSESTQASHDVKVEKDIVTFNEEKGML